MNFIVCCVTFLKSAMKCPPSASIKLFGCNSFAFTLYAVFMVFKTWSYPLQHFPLQNERLKSFLAFLHEAAVQAAFWHGGQNCLQCEFLFCFPCILSRDAQCIVGFFVCHYTIIERFQRAVGCGSRVFCWFRVQHRIGKSQIIFFLLFTTLHLSALKLICHLMFTHSI